MTKHEHFNARIKNLFGGKQGYRRNFAITIGVSPQTVYYWCTGKRHNNKTVAIPEYAIAILELCESIWIQHGMVSARFPERCLKHIKAHCIY